MKEAILEISNAIKNYTFGYSTQEECWNRIVHIVVTTTSDQVSEKIETVVTEQT